MRTIDLWFVCFQVWLAVWWLKTSGPWWIPAGAIGFLVVGMLYIWSKRRNSIR